MTRPCMLPGFHTSDARGTFSKPYSYTFGEVPFVIRELFWSASALGAVRGMHLQLPPAAAAKLVWVSHGAVRDVVIDVRPGAEFGRVYEFDLSAEKGGALLVPVGFAHGFQALTDGAVVNYAQDREFAAASDAGVNWRSAAFTWPLPVTTTSPRDDALPDLAAFVWPSAASGGGDS